METRKKIKWYEDYEVSNLSNVRHGDRKINPKRMKIWYRCIIVYGHSKPKTLYLHRLLAELFIPNPEKKKTVNHKDWNKDNNQLYNLERATQWENNKHAFDTWLKKPTRTWKFWKDNPSSKRIWQYDKEWNLIKIWDSWHDIRRELGISNKNISSVCKWRRPYAWWYSWEFIS